MKAYKGYLCLVLHAHLPYVRHPEHEYFLEENWFYEAITETYIPLLDTFSKLVNDGIRFKVTLSLSPTLAEMLRDNLLTERYKRHIENLIVLSEQEVRRTRNDVHFGPVARMYHERFRRISHLFEDVYNRDIVSAFGALQNEGVIEIIPSAATHAFLPNLAQYPCAVKAQIKIGTRHYRKIFGRQPSGFWLPECGYFPGIDTFLRDEGIRYFFLDTHGVMHGQPVPKHGVYAPVACASGLAMFGRDPETSQQVWSSVQGYPGDAHYRDFYRDAGFDLDLEHIKSFLRPFGTRTFTGIKYYRITGKTDLKEPYILAHAMDKAREHADNFIMKREYQIGCLSDTKKIRPVVTAMYDAELFGHWWNEGPEWLYFLLGGIGKTRRNFGTISPSNFLDLPGIRDGMQECEPSMSSWGNRGYNEVWLNSANDYIYRHLHKAAERMTCLAEQFAEPEGIPLRALNQAAREVLLAQHSDWTFIMQNNTASAYSGKRFAEHIAGFSRLYQALVSENIPHQWLKEVEAKNCIFRDIDYRVFRRD